MAGVTLLTPHLHSATDPSDFIAITLDAESFQLAVGGEIRTYASGRAAMVTTRQRSATYPLHAPFVSRDDGIWLEAMAGREVMFRDLAQHVVWGTYFDLDMPEFGAGLPYTSASFTFRVITKTAEV